MKTPKKKITVKDISIALNVSASTVSRALKNSSEISQKTKELIWEKAKEMGYLPNIPVYMQKQNNRVILFLIDSLNNSSYQEIIRSAQELLTKKDCFSLIFFCSQTEPAEDFLIKKIKDLDTAGIISLLENNPKSERIHQKIKEYSLPLVTAGKSHSDVSDINITPDITNGAYLAANHLIQRGAKNMLLVTDVNSNFFQNELKNGILTALDSDKKIQIDTLVREADSRSLTYKLDRLLENKNSFDSIFAGDHDTALLIYNHLNARNIKVPDDVMLVSFGNETTTDQVSSKISTIEFSSANLGIMAARMIDHIIKGKVIEDTISIEPVKFIIRSSSMKIY